MGGGMLIYEKIERFTVIFVNDSKKHSIRVNYSNRYKGKNHVTEMGGRAKS